MSSQHPPRLAQLLQRLEDNNRNDNGSCTPPESLAHARSLLTTYALLAEELPIHTSQWTPTSVQLERFAAITPPTLTPPPPADHTSAQAKDAISVSELEARLRRKLVSVVSHAVPTAADYIKTDAQLLAETKRLAKQIDEDNKLATPLTLQALDVQLTQEVAEQCKELLLASTFPSRKSGAGPGRLTQSVKTSFDFFRSFAEIVQQHKGEIDFTKRTALVDANRLVLENVELKLRGLCKQELMQQRQLAAQMDHELAQYTSIGSDFEQIARQYAATLDEIARTTEEIERVGKSYQ
ncbi:hypothetical protein RI367_001140 [Sorochytrium milnesiophthora]